MSAPVDPAAGDRRWMEQALALGALGEGATSPNPRVGCLLVRESRVVGSGFHRAPGAPHAEATAVRQAGDLARGATLYVNLEPCAHHGRTPPCADLLIRSGIRRVVASMQDPDPRVDGRGFSKLREAGIAVEVGLLQAAALALNEDFVQSHREGRPLVTIKAAGSLDGMISAAGGASKWITGEAARRFAHRLRLRHDAVLVGAGTVRRDDPRLDVRLPGTTRDVVRAVLAPRLDLDPGAALFREDAGRPPRIYCLRDAAAGGGPPGLRARAEIVPVADRGGALDLEEVLADLHALEVRSVLVEGGARTIAGFLDAGLARRAALFVAGRLLGARGGTPLLDRPAAADPGGGWQLRDLRQLALGEDLALLGRLVPPPAARGS
jgi:diaminohydroxyphosphoribosylaminopyrimidine deaminase/5-amino-6-(5-phosphoribosylamino)uracil reductase